jgi:UDP-N-acetylglucosamine 4-epimerase
VGHRLDALLEGLRLRPARWLVTGSAGFIGSHLVEALLASEQTVTSLDNFITGHERNLDEVRTRVGEQAWARHTFIRGDVAELETCRRAVEGIDFVLHQAAIGSVPRSIEDPLATHRANVDGFVNMLVASKDAGVRRFVYAASSSTYGDEPTLPKVEDRIGKPLSPYAVTKYVNELYADVFARCYGLETVGLRYFNVFGARQDPEGAYAAVIPCWVRAMLVGEPVRINGDGETSRDFCYVANAVQANLLGATVKATGAVNEVYNVAVSGRTSLNQLFSMLRELLALRFPRIARLAPEYGPFRPGDVRHSQADIGKAERLLGYVPTHDVSAGLAEAIDWYIAHLADGCGSDDAASTRP